MELVLVDDVTRNEYLSCEGYNELKSIMYDYLVYEADKTEDVADNYTNYSYKTFNSIKFASLILVEIDNRPYFIEELFYSEDGKSIYATGEYAKIKYNFQLV